VNRFRLLAAFLAILIVAIMSAALACEGEGENVTVENRSSEVVVVFEDGVPTTLLQPNVTEDFHVLRFSGSLTYSVQSFESQEVLAERTFTWDEIVQEDGITMVIE
jgi:hypothetical protein